MRMRIGKLRHRLTLEGPWRTPDGGGGGALAWESIAQVWGAIEMVSGGERVGADRLSGGTQTVITIRHRGDIAPPMRFTAGYRRFDIGAVLDPDGTSRFLRCLCEERDL
jgi:SPP1 family predicted phage head-tail adaptor